MYRYIMIIMLTQQFLLSYNYVWKFEPTEKIIKLTLPNTRLKE